MSNDIRYIKKIEIKDLWGRFDFVWNLNADVNVLGGANGTGKSTILECVYWLLASNKLPDNRGVRQIRFLQITFDNDVTHTLTRLSIKEPKKQVEAKAKIDNNIRNFIEVFKEALSQKGLSYNSIKIIEGETTQIETRDRFGKKYDTSPIILMSFVKTFDTILFKNVELPSSENIRTQLDLNLFFLEKQYLDYLVYQFKELSSLLKTASETGKDIPTIASLQQKNDKFLEIIDKCFEPTGKKLDRTKNKIAFLLGDQEIHTHELSSGEKQLLIILLTVLTSDNKPVILLMDEPEISLHSDWQEKLIQYIRELNPNCQIILATHSPTIIMDGWLDKVAEISDLITRDKLAPNKVSHAQ